MPWAQSAGPRSGFPPSGASASACFSFSVGLALVAVAPVRKVGSPILHVPVGSGQAGAGGVLVRWPIRLHGCSPKNQNLGEGPVRGKVGRGRGGIVPSEPREWNRNWSPKRRGRKSRSGGRRKDLGEQFSGVTKPGETWGRGPSRNSPARTLWNRRPVPEASELDPRAHPAARQGPSRGPAPSA